MNEFHSQSIADEFNSSAYSYRCSKAPSCGFIKKGHDCEDVDVLVLDSHSKLQIWQKNRNDQVR